MRWIFQLEPFQVSANVVSIELDCEFPMAVHLVPDEHFTPYRLPVWPAGFGTDSIFHAVPFQRSASAPTRIAVLMVPTAVQALADVHDTLCRPAASVSAGLGVCWIFQLEPFQRSANGRSVSKLVSYVPTAIQFVAVVHAIPSKRLICGLGLGVDWTFQLLPFQRSASVRPRPSLSNLPTAVQAVADVQLTPSSSAEVVPVGTEVGWIFQLVPFHRSASGSEPELVRCSPTAVHEVADVHDTPRSRRLSSVSAGLGVGWIFQLLPFHRSANALYPDALV